MTIAEMDTAARQLRELQSMADEIAAEIEALKDRFKAQMVEEGKEELAGNGWKAAWRTVVSQRFDSKAFKAADPETYSAYCKPSAVCRFTIT